jgi:uncharacterized protein (TIRG00374 family)
MLGLARELLDGVLVASVQEVEGAVAALFRHNRIVAEGAGACPGRVSLRARGVSWRRGSGRLGDVSLLRVRSLAASFFDSPWVRLTGSVVAVALFVHGVDLPQALRLYGRLVPGWVFLAVGLAALSVVASVAEWGVLLRGSGNRLDWSFLGSWYLKGLFVNQITPAGVGSDAMRALQVGKVTGHGPMVASLVASRMAGTLAMSWWALAAAVITRDRLDIPAVTGFVIFAAAMIVAWVLALVAEQVRRRIPKHRTIPHAMGQFVRPFTSAFERYRGHVNHTVGRSIAAGILAWGLNLFSMAAFSLALRTHVSWSVFALVLPIALLATFVPISANGIGVREGLVVLLLVQAHVALSTATALSLFVDLQLLPFAVLGGMVYLVEHRRHRRCERRGRRHSARRARHPPAR